MVVDNFSIHGQAIGRCVKEITNASATVFGQESRDGFIKATLAHRNMLPVNTSKKDLIIMILSIISTSIMICVLFSEPFLVHIILKIIMQVASIIF